MLLSQAQFVVIAFFSGETNAFGHKPSAASTAVAAEADTHTQPGYQATPRGEPTPTAGKGLGTLAALAHVPD